jgi:hypothetical protein
MASFSTLRVSTGLGTEDPSAVVASEGASGEASGNEASVGSPVEVGTGPASGVGVVSLEEHAPSETETRAALAKSANREGTSRLDMRVRTANDVPRRAGSRC